MPREVNYCTTGKAASPSLQLPDNRKTISVWIQLLHNRERGCTVHIQLLYTRKGGSMWHIAFRPRDVLQMQRINLAINDCSQLTFLSKRDMAWVRAHPHLRRGWCGVCMIVQWLYCICIFYWKWWEMPLTSLGSWLHCSSSDYGALHLCSRICVMSFATFFFMFICDAQLCSVAWMED